MTISRLTADSFCAALLAVGLFGSRVASADPPPYPPPTPTAQKFYDDMRAAGVVPLNNDDVNFNGAGILLCQYTWYHYLAPEQMDAIRRVITYRDFNQVQAIAKKDLCPNGPFTGF